MVLSLADVAFLARKLGWTLAEIRSLSPQQARDIVAEVRYQEQMEEYKHNQGLAMLLAAIYNTIPRKRGSRVFRMQDFLTSDQPRRQSEPTYRELAEKLGIKYPKEK